MKAAAAIIQEFDNDTIAQIEKTNNYTVDLGEVKYEIDRDDLDITAEDVPGWQVASDKELTVALDIQLDDELIAEGTARELVNRIQNLRKSNDFEVTDRINVKISEHDLVKAALAGYTDYIAAEVLADSITMEANSGEEVELLDGDMLNIEVKRG